MDRYRIRSFEPERDLEGAYRCFVQSFHHTLWPIIDLHAYHYSLPTEDATGYIYSLDIA